MLTEVLRDVLQDLVILIDEGRCKMSPDKLKEALSLLLSITGGNDLMSKQECCDYLGISRAAFDNHVRDGFIPHGFTKGGLLKFWNKSDIDAYIQVITDLEKL